MTPHGVTRADAGVMTVYSRLSDWRLVTRDWRLATCDLEFAGSANVGLRDDEAIAADLFGFIERRIRTRDQRQRIALAVLRNGNTNADRRRHRAGRRRHDDGADLVSHRRCSMLGAGARRVRENDEELVAAPPALDVAGPKCRRHLTGDGCQ